MRKTNTIIWLFLAGLMVIPQLSLAQSKTVQKANTLYESANYTKALARYKSATKKKESEYHSTYHVALCYKALDNPKDAAVWFKKALQFPGADNSINLLLAQELKKQKKEEESNQYFITYYNQQYQNENQRPFEYERYINQIDRDSAKVKTESLPINSEQSDYGPFKMLDNLIFSSNRNIRGLTHTQDTRTGLNFYSLFYVGTNTNGIFKQPKILQFKNSQKSNDGPACYHPESNILYLTQNRPASKNKKSTLTINTYSTGSKLTLDNYMGQLPFASETHSIAHPSITSDGRFLYFASDMPGGYGGWDLYRCEIKSGFYSKPINMGPKINTPGNEIFPYIASNGHLYFSSDGHPGKGGLDIFIALMHNDEIVAVMNPGKPINSPRDDFSIFIEEDGMAGFFSSNRDGGLGGDDIYFFSMKTPIEYTIVSGTVYANDNDEIVSDVLIEVIDKDKSSVIETFTKEDGTYLIVLKSSESYELIFTKRLVGTKTIFLAQPDLTGKKIVTANIKF